MTTHLPTSCGQFHQEYLVRVSDKAILLFQTLHIDPLGPPSSLNLGKCLFITISFHAGKSDTVSSAQQPGPMPGLSQP